MSTSKFSLKVSDERVQMYRARRNRYMSAAITDGDHEPEVDPYAFEEGDVKFTFSNKKDKAGGEREPGKKHKVTLTKGFLAEVATVFLLVSFFPIFIDFLLFQIMVRTIMRLSHLVAFMSSRGSSSWCQPSGALEGSWSPPGDSTALERLIRVFFTSCAGLER